MKIDGRPWRTIWVPEAGEYVLVIDQRLLPHRFEIAALRDPEDAFRAIREMVVRGAPLIGATAAYGAWLAAVRADPPSPETVLRACDRLAEARPTAVNLAWALDRQRTVAASTPPDRLAAALRAGADAIAEEDVAINEAIGRHGLPLIRQIAQRRHGEPVRILTHCNAGWLATVDRGTATSPIYAAHDAGLPVHVWVDETRPRNQGAGLTTWELGRHGVPHTLVTDNAGGHLMARGQVDLVVTGTDRTLRNGDVCNKIGTYLKALAARDNRVPFYVALPSPTIDWDTADGSEVPIEERDADEVLTVSGRSDGGTAARVRIAPEGTPAANPSFDVTPARLVTGLITERGLVEASEEGLLRLFPERRRAPVG